MRVHGGMGRPPEDRNHTLETLHRRADVGRGGGPSLRWAGLALCVQTLTRAPVSGPLGRRGTPLTSLPVDKNERQGGETHSHPSLWGARPGAALRCLPAVSCVSALTYRLAARSFRKARQVALTMQHTWVSLEEVSLCTKFQCKQPAHVSGSHSPSGRARSMQYKNRLPRQQDPDPHTRPRGLLRELSAQDGQCAPGRHRLRQSPTSQGPSQQTSAWTPQSHARGPCQSLSAVPSVGCVPWFVSGLLRC